MSARAKARFVEPMLLLRTDTLPNDGRGYELKLDGYRAIAFRSGAGVQLRSGNDNDFSARYAVATPMPISQSPSRVFAGCVDRFVQPHRSAPLRRHSTSWRVEKGRSRGRVLCAASGFWVCGLCEEAGGAGLSGPTRKSRPDASATDRYIAISSANMIGVGAVTIAERKYAQGEAPVFMYIFTHASDRIIPGTTHTMGAAHALEIRYKFNLVESGATSGGSDLMGAAGPDSVKTARNMSEMWSTFARTGRPAAKGQPAWPAYRIDQRATMEIDAQCRVVEDPYSAERQMWERLEP